MKLQIVKKESVVWPVTVNVPADGGGTEQHKFFARFKRLSEEEFDSVSKGGQNLLLKKVVMEVGDTEKDMEVVSAADHKELLADTNYRVGLYNAYLRMDAGVEEKN
ncbi:hypothetical protein [Alteromonas sp. RKMC-009]|uniref:hypothetical protein n=1 Tax=Alteromonas sp. RKMC-009 TaxID=2267264 RepID=UPI000E6A84E3|nr:hypothetical protein [Alteromonas sp. RKMC-009]AYA63827.1 hypothetical protein DS731_07335 [Alteromonas sp. RKMC-009]